MQSYFDTVLPWYSLTSVHSYLYTVLPLYSPISVQSYLYTVLPLYNSTSVQSHLCTLLPLYSLISVQSYLYIVLPLYSSTSVQSYLCAFLAWYSPISVQSYLCTVGTPFPMTCTITMISTITMMLVKLWDSLIQAYLFGNDGLVFSTIVYAWIHIVCMHTIQSYFANARNTVILCACTYYSYIVHMHSFSGLFYRIECGMFYYLCS